MHFFFQNFYKYKNVLVKLQKESSKKTEPNCQTSFPNQKFKNPNKYIKICMAYEDILREIK